MNDSGIPSTMEHPSSSTIVIAAFNARYAHASFGARYLMANLGELQKQAALMEFDLQVQPRAAVEKILALRPQVVGIGCYIWNIELVTRVAALIKAVSPATLLVLGGPEISYETAEQEIYQYADHVICGEGEIVFCELCIKLLGRRAACDTGSVPQAAGLPEEFTVPQAAGLPETTGFHPYESIEQTRRKNLPHWKQDGCTYFITFHLADSIPQPRIREYKELRLKWEEHHHPPYSEREQEEFNILFSKRMNEWLDAGAGSCCLSKKELGAYVAETLQHFNGKRYILDEWVVMPNHVHVLVKPFPGYELSTILHTWKSYSAHAINKALNRKGQLWKAESYDHIVRDTDELVRIRNYIRSNPEKAGIHVHFTGSRRAACGTDKAPALHNQESVPQTARQPRIIKAAPVDVAQIELPYELYTDEDIAHRAIYVEASRGCPFRCEYCMSSLDPAVRYFPEAALLSAFGKLLERGVKHLKFVDRTFNIDIAFALRILTFFRERYEPGMMLHFEVIPDHLPEELLLELKNCPPGMIQFEVGIQTFNKEVADRIQRPLSLDRIEANMRRLRNETGVHIHADLIAGLPGEDLDSFETGFNRLLALDPQEIQLGILKRLRGAPIARHTDEWRMVYSPHAPYEILSTSEIPFAGMQRIQRFARYWNLTVNNGRFIETAPLLWRDAPSPFAAFMAWSDWLYARTGTTGNLHMVRLVKLLLEFLTNVRKLNKYEVSAALRRDYQRGNRTDVPGFLKEPGRHPEACKAPQPTSSGSLPRQQRHRPKL